MCSSSSSSSKWRRVGALTRGSQARQASGTVFCSDLFSSSYLLSQLGGVAPLLLPPSQLILPLSDLTDPLRSVFLS